MFDGYVRDHAAWTPRAPAVVTPARAVSYAEFNADIDRFGAAMTQLGIDRSTGVVSICFDSPYLTLMATAALARLRIASSPYNDPGAALRLIDREGAGDEGPGPRLTLLDPHWLQAMRAAEPRPLPNLPIDPQAVGRVMLSSGTTQTPRRVGMSWRRLEIGNHTNIRTYGSGLLGTWVPLVTVESLLGFTMAVGAWSVGAAISGGVGVSELPEVMETCATGMIGGTPVQLRDLLESLPAGFQPKSGWRILTGGSQVPATLAQELRLRVAPDVRLNYGATESSVNALGPADDLETYPGLVGITPAGARMEILDDAGVPVADGQSGEIRVRSERMTLGYLDDEPATAERFADGWFYTRDVGRRLPDGRVIVEGRADDRMNLGGVKFMPGVLEDAALACPGVRDAAAFAVPGADGIDQCWLAVCGAPDFDRDSLAPHLAAYPDLPPPRFAWVSEIPRNAMGKVERSRLRDALLAAAAVGES